MYIYYSTIFTIYTSIVYTLGVFIATELADSNDDQWVSHSMELLLLSTFSTRKISIVYDMNILCTCSF